MEPSGPPGIPGPGGLTTDGILNMIYRKYDMRPVLAVLKTHWWP